METYILKMRFEPHAWSGNLVVLDYDGVLTSRTDGGFWQLDPEKYSMSEKMFARLVDFLERTDSKVVISSNWRKFDDGGFWIHRSGRYYNPLPGLRMRLGAHLFGDLGRERHVPKVEALRRYVEKNGPRNFIVFDDDPGEGFQDSEFRDRFVMTDNSLGLTESDCAKAELILAGGA